MGSMVYAGGCIVIQPSFDSERVLDAIKRFVVTKFYGVPTIYYRFLQLDNLKEKIGHSELLLFSSSEHAR